MATQEQIDAFNELDRRGFFKEKDQAVVEELRKRFSQPKEKEKEEPLRTIPLEEGKKIDVFAPKPGRYEKIIKEKEVEGVDAEIPLKETRFRYFTPDSKTGKPIFEPGYEALSETAGEFTKSLLTYPTLGFQPGEKFKKVVEEASGMPREKEVPFLQQVGYTLPIDIALGGATKPLFQKLAGTRLGKFLNTPLFRKAAVDAAATQVAENAIEKLAPQAAKQTPQELVEEAAKIKGMPTTAEPLLPKRAEKAGALNLDYLNTPEDVKSMLKDVAEQAPKAFKGAKISVGEMIEAAKDVGISEADILSGKLKGEVLHPRILAARQVMTKVGEDLFEAQKKLLAPGAKPEDLVAFRAMFDRAVDIVKNVREPVSEIARTLRSQQIAVGSQEYRHKAMKEVLKSFEGRKVTEEIARRFASVDMSNPREVAMFLREMEGASTADKVFEGYRNFLLSSPLTHVRNTVGNTMMLLTRTAERAAAPLLDIPRAILTGTPRERFFSELPKDVQSQAFGLWEGMKNARVAFHQELPIFGFDKFQDAAKGTAIKGALGKGIRTPQRLLMAADEVYKTIIYKAEISSKAFREATKEGLEGGAKKARIAELMVNPTEEMIESAKASAQHYTFQDPLGPIGNWIAQGRNKVPGLRYIVPFLQVSANIPKAVGKRTPLYLPWIAKRIATGELKGGAITDELAKVAIGTAALAPIFQLASEGKITGSGPRNPGERNVWLTTHQPNSVKIGNTWHQTRGIEPIGTFIGTIGDFHDIWDRLGKEDAIVALGTAIAKNLTNATYMQSLSGVVDAVTDPERYGKKYSQGFAGSIVPNIIGGFTRAREPELRKPEDALQAIRNRIPYIDKSDIPPVLDIWGNPVIREGSFASRFLWPIAKKEIPNDAATQEVSRLKMSVGSPAKDLNGVELTPNQYLFYSRYSGREAHNIVSKIIENKGYKNLADADKEDAIQHAFRIGRKKARSIMMKEVEQLRKDVQEKKRKEHEE